MADRRGPMGRGDDRPRIYLRGIMGGGVAWRIGREGQERAAANAGLAVAAALHAVEYREAVIFWEGRVDG